MLSPTDRQKISLCVRAFVYFARNPTKFSFERCGYLGQSMTNSYRTFELHEGLNDLQYKQVYAGYDRGKAFVDFAYPFWSFAFRYATNYYMVQWLVSEFIKDMTKFSLEGRDYAMQLFETYHEPKNPG